MKKISLIAILFFICLFPLRSYAGYGSTDSTREVSIENVMSHPLANREYNVVEVINLDIERDRPELTRTLVLLDDGLKLNNASGIYDKNKPLGKKTLAKSVKDYVDAVRFLPRAAGYVTVTPIKNRGTIVGWVIRQNTGVKKVSWWAGKEKVSFEFEYAPTNKGMDSTGSSGSDGGGGSSCGSGGGGD